MGGGDNEIKETSAQIEAQKVAIDQYNMYMKEYRPFEKKFIADVVKPTAMKEAAVAGQVNADVAQQSAVQVDPSRNLRNTLTAKADVEASAVNEAQQAVKGQRVKGMQAVSDIGMGKETEANLSFQGIASNSLNKAVAEKKSEIAVDNAIASGVMGAVGTGAAVYNNWSNSPQNIEGNTWMPDYGYANPGTR